MLAATALLLLVHSALPLPARTPARLAEEKVRQIEEAITLAMSEQRIPGMSIAAAIGGALVWSNGYGMADLENFVPAKASTVYRTASIAKPLTAVAAMQLSERDLLNLDASVNTYVAALAERPELVTTRLLLGHLGGVRTYRDDKENFTTTHYWSISEALRTFQEDPLVSEPGSAYLYSTLGYVLVGAVIEAASGKSYLEYMHEHVFEPAGMRATRSDDTYALIPNRSRGYQKVADGSIRNCALTDTSLKIPGGGLVSTAEDLVRFGVALGKGELLKPESMEEMFTPLKTTAGEPTYYGLGWGIGEFEGHRQVSHSGGQAGVSTVLRYLPGDEVAVAIMFNLEGVRHAQLADRVLQILLQ